MAKSTRQYVFEGMELLPSALIPFVEKRLETSLKGHWQVQVLEKLPNLRPNSNGEVGWDQAALFNAMDRFWAEAFKTVLGRAERSLVNELGDVRNKLSHNETFTYDDAERALDSMRRLMEAISAGETAEQLGKMRDTILRTKFTELARNEERRKTQRLEISVDTVAGLLPWREVVEPHQDVATGEFQQAEFAADLAKVHSGSAPPEYRDPRQFFSRTYLTEGLSTLLIGAAKRLSGSGGDPVVELQTNFGGGKTHSMLALYHMAGPTPVQDLSGLDQLLDKLGLTVPKAVNRAVLVGTSRGPQDVLHAEGDLKIRTTWGELAWQLGGADAFAMVAENDASGIAPGSNLLEALFKKYAPCLILIDEWVAYLRQIYKVEGLPSGSFDANLSFVQSLTEAVKASPGTLLVASLPASQIEVGGEGGQEALARLKQTFSRVESSWRPASQEESYEIVRRRLFKEIPGDKFHHRDNTLKQFAKLYRENANDFPQGCADEDYRRKLEKAYPIHPELFDQLYTSWGSLEKFQRTRGVLRLMAQAIHELWMNADPSVMIMPGSVAVSSPRVEPELLHYLDVTWQSIIAGDVDGTASTPYKVDQSAPNLNRYSATRRVARAIFMGTAPTHQQQNTGLDDKQINLGVVQPGERPAIFGDALRRLTNQAKFMHADLGRYWYSMSASLNRIAADKAAQIEAALVDVMIDSELGKYVNGLADRGHFDAVQVAPASSAEVPDEAGGVRVVVLGVQHSHNGRDGSDALVEAKDILTQRGSTPRVYRNMLVFIAAEARQLRSSERRRARVPGVGRDRARHRAAEPHPERQCAGQGEAGRGERDDEDAPERGVVLSALSRPGKRTGGLGMGVGQDSGAGRAAGPGEQEAGGRGGPADGIGAVAPRPRPAEIHLERQAAFVAQGPAGISQPLHLPAASQGPGRTGQGGAGGGEWHAARSVRLCRAMGGGGRHLSGAGDRAGGQRRGRDRQRQRHRDTGGGRSPPPGAGAAWIGRHSLGAGWWHAGARWAANGRRADHACAGKEADAVFRHRDDLAGSSGPGHPPDCRGDRRTAHHASGQSGETQARDRGGSA
ncbi:DUF499 domain-containing protein [Roseibium aggregatum]|uniref:DUF499 domain-containing protein n=1 Tax=Roseibium aggregatum TaxID=187304 RepID=UPI002E281720|nr:DUF499 domain-containing protein [Roseibium aggregatum]